MSARQVARFLDGAAAGTACAALASATIVIPGAFAAACPDVEVVFARATTEPPGIGAVGQAFVDSLRSQVGGKSISRTFNICSRGCRAKPRRLPQVAWAEGPAFE